MEETNNTNNSKALWLTIVFVLLAVGLWSVVGGNPLKLLEKKQEIEKEVPKIETLSVDKDLANLESRANFPKLIVKSSVNASINDLPKEISSLILKNASAVDVKKVTYVSGSVGLSVTYLFDENVLNTYNNIYSAVRDSGMKIGLASRTFSAAVVSAENSKNKVLVSSQYISDKSSLVKVSVLDNK